MREVKLVKARSEHLCMWCHGTIGKGEVCYRFIEASPKRFTLIYGHVDCVRKYRKEVARWRSSRNARISSPRWRSRR